MINLRWNNYEVGSHEIFRLLLVIEKTMISKVSIIILGRGGLFVGAFNPSI